MKENPIIRNGPNIDECDPSVKELILKMEENVRRDVDPVIRKLQEWRFKSEQKNVVFDSQASTV